MKRRHLFELEDQRWFPTWLRNIVTDVLREGLVLGRDVYGPAVPLLAKLIRDTDADRVVDLCSGGGGPWPRLKRQLADEGVDFELVLTDKYPNIEAFDRTVTRIDDRRTRFEGGSVDATNVPDRLSGIRTIFTGFHHFQPEVGRRVLRDAYERRESIAVFEFTERRWGSVLLTVPLGPLLTWMSVPRIRPLTARRLLFTYPLPVTPLAVMWDGIVSNLRTYLPEELADMVRPFSAPGYRWETGRIVPEKGGGGPVTYLVGQPVGPRAEPAGR